MRHTGGELYSHLNCLCCTSPLLLRQAYRAYEEQMMPRLKAENPTLKRSQLLELLSKQVCLLTEV